MNRRNEEKEGDITWESITKAREKPKQSSAKVEGGNENKKRGQS